MKLTTNTDQVLTFDEDAEATLLDTIVVSENDSIQASTDSSTASDDTVAERVSVVIELDDENTGSFSADSGNDESFSSGVWSISNVSVSVANAALAELKYHLLQL